MGLDDLKTDLSLAVRAAVTALRNAKPDEAFYAFALFTDDDAAGVSLAANSEEGFARTVARYNFKDERENVGLRWYTSEWEYKGFGLEHFSAFDAAIESTKPASEREFKAYRKRMLSLMVDVLAGLDAEHFFGEGVQRERVTLLCAITDADSAGEKYQEQSIRKLNPPAVVAGYQVWLRKLSEPQVNKGPPCPKCGKPLRTAKAQQCFLCGAKWHGQSAAG